MLEVKLPRMALPTISEGKCWPIQMRENPAKKAKMNKIEPTTRLYSNTEVATANARVVCLLGKDEFFFDGDGGNKCTQNFKNGRGLK